MNLPFLYNHFRRDKTMNINEQSIRNHFKSLTTIERDNSSYFKGVDFDTEPIESLFRKLDSLYEETRLLEEMINSNFKSTDGYPSPEPLSRLKIIEDYRKKSLALSTILCDNKDVMDAFWNYKENREKESSVATK